MSEITSILLEPSKVLEYLGARGIPEPHCQIYMDRTVYSWTMGSYGGDPEELVAELHREFPQVLLRAGDVPWVEDLVKLLTDRKEMIATAESCTGGLIGAILTEIPGSSRVYWGGCITYSNEAKIQLLGIPQSVLMEKGAVSRETVTFMAEQARKMGNTQWAIGVSGIAGPTGGTVEKPVGTVYIALARTRGHTRVEKFLFKGTRHEIRIKTAFVSILLLESAVKDFDIDIERLNAYI